MGRFVAALSWLAPIAGGGVAYGLGGVWACVGGVLTGLAFLVWAHDHEVRALNEGRRDHRLL